MGHGPITRTLMLRYGLFCGVLGFATGFFAGKVL